MDKAEVIQALSALAHPVRLDVFRQLVIAGPEGITPGQLIELVDAEMKQNTMSTHLKELSNAGLAVQERAGRNVIYRAAYDQMDAVIGFLTKNCCQGLPAKAAKRTGDCQGC